MMSNYKLFCKFYICLAIYMVAVTCCSCSEVLSDVLKLTLKLTNSTELTNCGVILVHDYYITDKHGGLKITSWLLLLNNNYQYVNHLPLYSDVSKDLVDGEKAPYSSRISNCLLVLIIAEDGDKLNSAAIHFMTTIRYQMWNDKFILWQRDGLIGNTFLHYGKSQITRRMLYKLGVTQSEKNMLQFITECFYCDGGNPTLVEIDNIKDGGENENGINGMFPLMATDYGKKALVVSFFFKTLSWEEILENVERNHGSILFLEMFEKDLYEVGRTLNVGSLEMIVTDGGGSEVIESRYPNGTWVGSVDMLLKNKIDMAYYPQYTHEAMDFVDLLYPYAYLTFDFVTGFPAPVLSWKTVLWPYQFESWLFITLTTTLSVIVLAFLKYYNIERSSTWKSSLSFSLLYCILSLIKQIDNEKEFPQGDALRAFAVFWLLATIVLAGGYQEMLLAFLTVPVKEWVPSTMEELIHSHFTFGMAYQHGILTTSMAEKSDSEDLKYIVDNYIPMENIESCVWECTRRKHFGCLSAKLIVYVASSGVVDRFGNPLLHYVSSEFTRTHYSVMLKRDEPIGYKFNKVLTRYFESGFLEVVQTWSRHRSFLDGLRNAKMKARHGNDSSLESSNEDNLEAVHHVPKVLTLKKLFGPFILLLFGLVLGASVFLFEICFACKKLFLQNYQKWC